jgi:hypothetical protein
MAPDLQIESRKIPVGEFITTACGREILASELVFAHTGKGEGIFVCATTYSSEGV